MTPRITRRFARRGSCVCLRRGLSPEQARFLTVDEKTWLAAKLLAEHKAKEAVQTLGEWQAMFDPRVLLLALNFFGIVTATLGMTSFLPRAWSLPP